MDITGLTHQQLVEKIENATPLELCIINHLLLLQNLDKAIAAAPKSAENKAALDKSRDCLGVLYETLDDNVEFSQDLALMYLIINRVLIRCEFLDTAEEKTENLNHARKIVSELLSAWQFLHDNADLIEKQAASGQIIAGLTYDAEGKLTEFEDYDPKGGYKI
ncbi:MAG: flagellar protein FliS [Defluviitaleaceae bacterium]|nr:flagellar protein FliS [Defluviitaleaceae bacterium]